MILFSKNTKIIDDFYDKYLNEIHLIRYMKNILVTGAADLLFMCMNNLIKGFKIYTIDNLQLIEKIFILILIL